MIVKVVKCSRPTYWYSSHIGQTYETTTEGSDYLDAHRVWRDKNCEAVGYIMKDDSNVVSGGGPQTDQEKLILFLEWFVRNDIDMTDDSSVAIVERYLEETNNKQP
jgi:hypothetical protein